MRRYWNNLCAKKFRVAACIFYLLLGMSSSVANPIDGKNDFTLPETVESSQRFAFYDWNLNQDQRPLLSLPDQINPGTALSLAYPMGQFRFPLFQTLHFDDRSGKYILQLLTRGNGRQRTIELKQTGAPGSYASSDGSDVHLRDNRDVRTIQANDATEYTFVRFTDGTIRCIRVKSAGGSIITLVYTRDNLIHGLVDSSGRTIKFNYEDHRIGSITQTWVANSVPVTKTWSAVADQSQLKLAHAYSSPSVFGIAKLVPNNAVTQQYTQTMASNDKQLAGIFGGPGAVAAANGFEPIALGKQYPLYRGDFTGDDGRVFRGHLSYAMHLYGDAQGSGDSALYVPAGFTSHSPAPTPTDAAVTFYYPRLGNLTNVTLAVFHVANFSITYEGGRVRIGNIGGPGGSCATYKHSHIEFYRGDTGLPSASARSQRRIDPAIVFGFGSGNISRSMNTRSARRSE